MKTLNRTDTAALVADFDSAAIHLESMEGFSICASWTNTTPGNDTFVSGVLEIQTLTFPAFAGIVDRDYIVVYDQAGVSYAVYADKTGTSVAPTGAAYTAATRKVKADISADVTAAQVAARFETAFNSLTGFTAAITSDDTAADGTMLLTQTVRGPTTNPVPHNLNDSTAGTLAGIQTTGGVTSGVDLVGDTFNLGAHGFYTGLKIRFTTTGTLPTGVATATDYFVIATSADLIQVATSLNNANLGTQINITGYGAGTHTAVVQDTVTGTLKLQASNNAFTNNVNNNEDPNAIWVDIPGSSVAVSGAGSQLWNVSDVYYSSARLVWARTVGIGAWTAFIYAKGVE